ncbi:TRAF3-interacting protein 1 isoform X2 [Sphaerodactylus townsendi]|uniref:TRAF3-interacting protein 1 isoform X2 n=1 Tax=Sphaerodactylus townsendi TaxID=933632 RepID=UPI002026B051|nr:TRAF3-interacting protein 1 isoform X2 [Sphaerodactylus townsendi]
MEGSMVRRTQELLGRVIRKPPLTERLLSKPPFRYLHDVIGEVIRSTGFMKGLYNEAEMKSDNVKDKDSKIAFLQKAIDVVMMVTGESLAVKPGRIVAGHEPERTNEFLQAIAKCCLSKLSSDDAVQKVLAGEKADVKRKTPSSSKSQNKEIKESKGEEQRSPKEGRGLSELKDKNTDQDQIAKEEVKEAESKEKESDKPKENENKQKTLHKDPHKEGERHEKERTKNRMSKPGREAEKNRDKEKGEGEQEKDPERAKGRDRERRHDGGREKDRSKEKDKERGKNREKEHEKDRERGKDRERERRRERGKDAEQAREHGKDKGEKKSTGLEDNIMRKTEERLIKEKAEPDEESESLARLSRQHSTKGARQRGKTGSEGESASDAEGDTPSTAAPETMVTVENGELNGEPPPQVNLRRLPRPSSARPAPPRIRRQESAEILQPERNGSARIVSNVIIDKEEEEEEDDQFVVEASSEVPELTEIATEAAVELEGDEKHGGLVKRILETKKDYELSQAPKSAEKEKPLLYESARRKEKDLVAREVDKFRGSIQALCRSALPLGKLMDYIQEDMDAVKNEYQMWKNENKQLAEALQKEQSITDSAVEPLKAKLAELDQLIRDEQDKICAKRAAVLRNDEKIRKMILNINSRK